MMLGLALTFLICLTLFGISLIRPQWGVIAIAGLLPFHGLLLIAPVSMNSWKEAAILAILVACPFARRVGRDRAVAAPWLVPLVLLIPLGTVSAVVAFGSQAFFPLKIAFFYLVLSLIVVLFPFARADKDLLVSVLFGAGLVTASYGIWQQIIGPFALADMGYQWNEQIRSAGPLLRSFGTFNQPFGFGLFLMLVIILGASVALAEPHRLRSRIFLVTFPILAAGLVFSVVRASHLGVAVGLVAIGLILYRRLLVWLAVGLVAAVPVLLAYSAVFGTSVLNTLVSSSSLEERGGHWSVNLPLILSRPFGAGLGTTGSSAEKVSEGHNPWAVAYQPDSNYMKILLELGPVGLAGYAVIVALMVVTLVRMIPYTRDPLERGVLVGAAGVAVAACAAAFFSTYLEIFPMDAYFWLLPAVAASTTTTVRDRVTGRLGLTDRWRPVQPWNLRLHTTRSTIPEMRSRKDSSEKSAANRDSAAAG